MGKYGKCHLCGKEEQLTFEHLPPQKANNNQEAHAIVGDNLMRHIAGVKDPWDFKGVRYKKLQRGMGGYTLCSTCNNNTGNWYAKHYTDFANTIGYVLNNKVDLEKTESMYLELKDMYPLRIIKQILCMFASTMHPGFLEVNKELKEFILDKESRNFNSKKYRVSMYALKNRSNGWSGLTALLYDDFKTIRKVAYMDLYPVGFILELDPTQETYNYTSDITSMATEYDYNTKGILGITLNILERNNFFPGDFRTKEEIKKQMDSSKKETVQMIKEQMEELHISESNYKMVVEEYLGNEISSGEFLSKIEEIKKNITGDNELK